MTITKKLPVIIHISKQICDSPMTWLSIDQVFINLTHKVYTKQYIPITEVVPGES